MLYVLVLAGILESMPADVGRIGAVLTSGNAAAAGPDDGRGGLGGRRSVGGDCGAVLSGCCRVRKRKINLAELAASRIGRA
jgi:hypothetical protein